MGSVITAICMSLIFVCLSITLICASSIPSAGYLLRQHPTQNVRNETRLLANQTSTKSFHINASAGNRTRVTSMATMYSTTRPLMLMPAAKFNSHKINPRFGKVIWTYISLLCFRSSWSMAHVCQASSGMLAPSLARTRPVCAGQHMFLSSRCWIPASTWRAAGLDHMAWLIYCARGTLENIRWLGVAVIGLWRRLVVTGFWRWLSVIGVWRCLVVIGVCVCRNWRGHAKSHDNTQHGARWGWSCTPPISGRCIAARCHDVITLRDLGALPASACPA